MSGRRGRWLVTIAFVGGAIVRLAALPLPGTGDVGAWKIWSYSAVTEGVTRVYGVGPLDDKIASFNGMQWRVNYPPLSLYELDLAGRTYRYANRGRFPDTPALTVAMKAVPVVFEIGFVVLVFAALRRSDGESVARWAFIGYWLNPAALVDASIGGYLDPLFVLPAAASLAAAVSGWPILAGGLMACGALTKPQGVIVAPVVLLTIWNAGDPQKAPARLAAGLMAAAATSAILLAPIVAAGAWWNMIRHMLYSLKEDDRISMSAYNVWWLAGHIVPALYAARRGSNLWTTLASPATDLPFDRVAAHGISHLAILGAILTSTAIAWGLWTGRRARDLPLMAAIGAFSVQAYATLALRVHENHAFAAVPLLVVAAASRRRFTPILVAVSALFTLNLVFFGLSEDGRFRVPRHLTIVDTTLLLAVCSCIILGWFAAVLRAECSAEQRRSTEGRRVAALSFY